MHEDWQTTWQLGSCYAMNMTQISELRLYDSDIENNFDKCCHVTFLFRLIFYFLLVLSCCRILELEVATVYLRGVDQVSWMLGVTNIIIIELVTN